MKIKFKVLHSFLNDYNYSYEEIAEIINSSKERIKAICENEQPILLEEAIKICTLFNTTPDDIFLGELLEDESFQKEINTIKNKRKEKVNGK